MPALNRYAVIDARVLEDTRFLQRQVELPYLKSRQPAISPGQAYGSVLRDPQGNWRMYYLHGKPVPEGFYDIIYRTCLATSTDGIHWEKPTLDLIPAPDLPVNNAIIADGYIDANGMDLTGMGGSHGFCVIDSETTPHPAARSRYTAMYQGWPRERIGGMCLAGSDDGLRWTLFPESPVLPGPGDFTPPFFYDRRIGKYVMYARPEYAYAGIEAHACRKIARCISDDLVHWTTPRVVLDTDDLDCPPIPTVAEDFIGSPSGHRGRDKQFYIITAFPYQELTVGLLTVFDVPTATLHVELAHSYDGIDWKRELARRPYVAGNGTPEGIHGAMICPMQSPPIPVGDELFFYVFTSQARHTNEDLTGEGIINSTQIHLLALKRDRWIGYAAGEVEGELLTSPFPWEVGRLGLNARIEEGGWLQVSFTDEMGLPLREFHLDEIPPITGPVDAVDHTLTFGPGPKSILVFPTRGPVRMRIKMSRATLFGWSFT